MRLYQGNILPKADMWPIAPCKEVFVYLLSPFGALEPALGAKEVGVLTKDALVAVDNVWVRPNLRARRDAAPVQLQSLLADVARDDYGGRRLIALRLAVARLEIRHGLDLLKGGHR